MPSSGRIPPLLQPYVDLPLDDSLILLTSILDASANWLILRFLCHALNTSHDAKRDGHNIVFVSWMRDYEFWKLEARKGVGLDLKKLEEEKKIIFVDGLSRLCVGEDEKYIVPSNHAISTPGSTGAQISSFSGTRTQQSPPTIGGSFPARASLTAEAPTVTTVPTFPPVNSRKSTGYQKLEALDLMHLKSTISSAVSSLALSTSTMSTAEANRKTLIVLDNPDLLLALDPTIDASDLVSSIMALHTLPTVSHVLLHLQADDSLLGLSPQPQPLELTHHNFVVRCAHMSQRIIGIRALDTGPARDVSGVVRITEQAQGWLHLELDKEDQGEDRGEGKEFLYQVKGDGNVRVFERGACGDG